MQSLPSKQESIPGSGKGTGDTHELQEAVTDFLNTTQSSPRNNSTDVPEENTSNSSVDLYQVNIQGLITLHNNKSKFLKKTIEHGNNHKKIVAITETWANKNFDAEYKNAFQGYNIRRSDRTEKPKGTDVDPEHLDGRGGVMILTSGEIPITPVDEFSNGNCEAMVVNLQTINTAVAVLYRPSGDNFSPEVQ